ncbi:MAG: undecaprenyl-diphosphate phosphatase [Bacillota bacterium]|nr:MAG: undecaprenyl-diphosphate phosphatase [Bacillota bacterium]
MELSLWQVVVLGVVQGLTEFLPVSSSGHLVVFQELLGIHLEGVGLEIAVHLGTLAAVLAVYRGDVAAAVAGGARAVVALLRGRGAEAWREDPGAHLALLVIVGTLPAVVAGLAAKDAIEAVFESPLFVAGCWLVTGALLWWVSGLHGRTTTLQRASLADALAVGLFQAVALLPGISRSGSTIAGARLRGLSPEEAARLSFLLSLPAIIGAAVLVTPDVLAESAAGIPWTMFLAGGLTAALTGYAAIRWLLRWLATGRLHWFAYYLWAAAIAVFFLYRYSGR